ncbi:hypothetical protein PSPO01_16585 [Paraphaeosphaeria sporulosa]
MSELDLQCPLPRGIETWISYNGEHSSTIDLILVTQELASEIQGDVDSYCQFITECIAPAIEKHVPVARP